MSLKDLFGGAQNNISGHSSGGLMSGINSTLGANSGIAAQTPWASATVQGPLHDPRTDDTVTIRIKSCANGKTITLGGEVWVAAESDDILPIIAAALASAKLK